MQPTTEFIHQSQQYPTRFKVGYRPATLREKIWHWWNCWGWITDIAVYEAVHFGERGYDKAPLQSHIIEHEAVLTLR